MQFRGIIADFQLANPLYIGGTVAFFLVDDDGRRTNVLANLYANPTGEQRLQNPQTLDGDGKFTRPVYFEDAVVAEVTSANVGTHDTGVIAPAGRYRGMFTAGVQYLSGDYVQSPTRTIYVSTQVFTASTIAADLAAGKLALVLGPDEFIAERTAIEMALADLNERITDFEPVAAQFPDIRTARDQALQAAEEAETDAQSAANSLAAIQAIGAPSFAATQAGKILTVGPGGTSVRLMNRVNLASLFQSGG